MKMIKLGLAAAALGLLAGNANAMDPAAGEKVFRKCKACHVVESDKNKVGPSLANLFGRAPGAVEGYKYSKAMVKYGEDKVWNEDVLKVYLAAPKKEVKGTKMAFAGLKKEEDILNIIAYLKQYSPDYVEGGDAAEGSEATESTESN